MVRQVEKTHVLFIAISTFFLMHYPVHSVELPVGWEVEEGKIVRYPFPPNKGESSYEMSRMIEPDTCIITRCLTLKETLPQLLARGLSIHFLVDREGKIFEWIPPRPYAARYFGREFNDRTIGFLAETPGAEEEAGNGSLVEEFTFEEVEEKLADQALSPEQVESIAEAQIQLRRQFPCLSYFGDYYHARHGRAILEPGQYGFSRISNLLDLKVSIDAKIKD